MKPQIPLIMQSNSSDFFTLIQKIESGKIFQTSVVVIIILSALTTGAKTYDLPEVVEPILSVFDTLITLFFLIEIIFRFVAAPIKKKFFNNGWNVFDTIIVIGSLIPLQDADVVLIGRLLRVFRVLRLVSVIPDLRFLINSLLKAIPRMGYIAVLMFIIFYIYAAVGSLFYQDINDTLWGDVSIAMLTLFRVATFEDWTDVMYETMEVYPLSWLYYLTFIFLTAFVFLNMMVGAILEVMSSEQNARQADQANQQRADMSDQLITLHKKIDQLTEKLEAHNTAK